MLVFDSGVCSGYLLYRCLLPPLVLGDLMRHANSRMLCVECVRFDCEHTRKVELLADRQVQVIRNLTLGVTGKELAYRMGITYGTLKIYLNRIFKKTGTSKQVELVVWANKNPEVWKEK